MAPSSKPALVGFLAVSAILCWLARAEAKKSQNESSRKHRVLLSEEEQWIQSSIRATMPPAQRMGIAIESLDLTTDATASPGSLSLSMPLEGNTNVHGSAFAGSLYSLSVLCAWYALVCHLRAIGIADRYSVVVKTAQISYKRPVVRMERVVATSVLPSWRECQEFVAELEKTGKTTIQVSGTINVQEKTAVEYTALLCGFKPRSAKK